METLLDHLEERGRYRFLNNENVRKPSSTKRVYIVGDSIVKHVNGYDISRKTKNSKVFARPSHGATVICMTDHVKPVLRDNPDHIVFHPYRY